MKNSSKLIMPFCLILVMTCSNDDDRVTQNPIVDSTVNFQFKTSINIGGEGASEILAYDPISKKLFTVNVESNQISVTDISDLNTPFQEQPIDLNAFGTPNSVSINKGRLAVAVEAEPKQNPGKILVYNTLDNTILNQFTVGALPDMVTFTNDGNLIISANEGEPNDDYTNDPKGTISIIDLSDTSVITLDFSSFNGQESSLENQGFRVFGPNANLAQDVEPEYVAISSDSKTAWVSLQENNGIAEVNLVTKTITNIYPLGYKDYSIAGNAIDASDRDGVKELKNWPVYGMFQPDAIVTVSINGIDHIISANEGDTRDYVGFSEEERVDDLVLDETAFPVSEDYQDEINIGRLKTTTTIGDIDNDGDYDVVYSYGARSFSIWSTSGSLVYDSGNSIATETLNATPDRFNDNDARSDDKGAEPESLEVLNIGNERYILFVGLERNDQVLVYDITNPMAPQFLNILSHTGDKGPEGLLAINAEDSPSGKALLVVSNEYSGTVTIYENGQ